MTLKSIIYVLDRLFEIVDCLKKTETEKNHHENW